MEFKFLIFVFI